jgi:hypothetical protein
MGCLKVRGEGSERVGVEEVQGRHCKMGCLKVRGEGSERVWSGMGPRADPCLPLTQST